MRTEYVARTYVDQSKFWSACQWKPHVLYYVMLAALGIGVDASLDASMQIAI